MGGADLFDISGKVALVTGAARGLGQAIAVGLAEAGASLALLDLHSCEETCALVDSSGKRSMVVQCNLEQVDAYKAKEVIAEVVQGMGRIDILVNNAGIINRSTATEYSARDWHQVMAINLNATFFLCQAAGHHFLENKQAGKIINLASMLSFQGGMMVPAYTASKSGVAGLTKALANEWAIHGINVNALAPGYFSTEVTLGIRNDAERSANILSRISAGRWGDPDDLKGAAVFLASAASDYMHGTILPVDGGWLAR